MATVFSFKVVSHEALFSEVPDLACDLSHDPDETIKP